MPMHLQGWSQVKKRANLAQEKKKKKKEIHLTVKLECFIDKVKGCVANFRKSLKPPI